MSAPDEMLRGALEQIIRLRPAGDISSCKQPRKLVEEMENIALRALSAIAAVPTCSELPAMLTGRARFLRGLGEVKSPSLMESAASAIEHAWTGDGTRCADDGYEGPICARCGCPDLPETEKECKS